MTTEAKVLRELLEAAKQAETETIYFDGPDAYNAWNAYNRSVPVDSISRLDSTSFETIVQALEAILSGFEGNESELLELSEHDVKNALCALLEVGK